MNSSSIASRDAASLAPKLGAPLDVAGVLNAAADLIEKPGAWIKGAMSRTAAGHEATFAVLPDAVCFCALGAIGRVTGKTFHAAAAATPAARLLEAHVRDSIPIWNDHIARRQADVVEALRAAAAKADGSASDQDGQLGDEQ